MIIFVILLLGGCSKSTEVAIDKPFAAAGDQTFTMSSELYSLLKADQYSFNQIDQNTLLFNKGDNYYVYDLKSQKLDEFNLSHADLVAVIADKGEVVSNNGKSLILSDYSGNIIKHVDNTYTYAYQNGDYIITSVQNASDNSSDINIYDLDLNLHNHYAAMKLTLSVNYTFERVYDYSSTQVLLMRTLGYNEDEGKLYVYSNGSMNFLTDGIDGYIVGPYVYYTNDEYLIFAEAKDGESGNTYVYNEKLVNLGNSEAIFGAKLGDRDGHIIISNLDHSFDIYSPFDGSLTPVNSAYALYCANESYFTDAGNNQYIEHSFGSSTTKTYKLPYDEPFHMSNIGIFEVEGQTLAYGYVGFGDYHRFWFKDDGVDEVKAFYYDSASKTLVIISNDMSKFYFYRDNQLVATSQNSDINELINPISNTNVVSICNENIVKINGTDVKFYGLDGQFESEGTLLSPVPGNISFNIFKGLHTSYANRLVLMDSDTLEARLIATDTYLGQNAIP